ncbi:hypothetical protein F5B18DRAFT_607237, partial [Nemania serpens]
MYLSLSSPENASNSRIPASSRPSSSSTNAPSDTASPGDASPEPPSPGTVLLDTASRDDASPDNASPENSSPDYVSNWRNPLSYGTTLLLAAASLALYTFIPRLLNERVAQIMAPKNMVGQVPAPAPASQASAASTVAQKDPDAKVAVIPAPISDAVRALPGKDDIIQLGKNTSESVSRYTTAALSRYTTKSRTVVSTSNINHDETSVSVTSSQLEIESSETTPEEVDI